MAFLLSSHWNYCGLLKHGIGFKNVTLFPLSLPTYGRFIEFLHVSGSREFFISTNHDRILFPLFAKYLWGASRFRLFVFLVTQ